MSRNPLCAAFAACAALICASLTATAQAEPPTEPQTSSQALFAAKTRAVVHVYVRIEKAKDQFGKDWFKDEDDKRTGVVLDPSGLVLTHWEVCAEAFQLDGTPKDGHSIQIQLEGGTTIPAQVAAKDPGTDLALLRFEPPTGAGNKLEWLELADSDKALPGETVTTIGSPDGEDTYTFSGVVARAASGVELGRQGLGTRVLKRHEILVTDASIRPTNNAGPLLDIDGRLLGLCNAKYFAQPKQDPTPEDLARPNFGIAVSANTIRASFSAEFAATDLENKTLKTAPSPEAPRNRAAQVLATQVREAIVCVHTSEKPPAASLTDPHGANRIAGVGSGVVIDDSGLIITNRHIVDADRESVRITTLEGRTFPAEVLDTDRNLGIALLQVASTGARLKYAPLGDSSKTLKGERVLAVGNPRGHALSVTGGVVSAKNRQRRIANRFPFGDEDHFQIDAPVDASNSGGAVLDANGRVIAILNAGDVQVPAGLLDSDTPAETNIGFALPINLVRKEFRSQLDQHAGSNETTVTAAAESETERELHRSRITALADSKASSMINVYVAQKVPKAETFDPFADDEEEFIERGLGSGVIIDKNGLAITNWHVVDGADSVRVRTGTGVTYAAEVLSTSRIDDLALLQLELEDGATVDPIVMGDSDLLPVGSTVIAIGNPLGHANTVTVGVLSAKDQAIGLKGRGRKFEGLIQTDAAINPGNSGGALLDLEGRLVGINSAGSNADAEVGYAIPVNHVVDRFNSKLLSAEKLNRAYLGMIVVDDDAGKPVVRSLDRFGPAARAGFKIGDMVRAVGAQQISNRVDFVRIALDAPADQPLRIDIERDGETMTLEPSPISNLVWTVFRQTGIELEQVDGASDADTIRNAQVAMYRHYSGDRTGEPSRILPTAVRVVRVRPSEDAKPENERLKAGDIVMGLDIVQRSIDGDSNRFVNLASLARLGDVFRGLASKTGTEQTCFVYRDGKIVEAQLSIRRAR